MQEIRWTIQKLGCWTGRHANGIWGLSTVYLSEDSFPLGCKS